MASKFYNALLLICIKPKIKKILWKKEESTISQILIIHQILEGVWAKNLQAIFIDCSKTFDSIERRKLELIQLVYSLPKEPVIVIMILYKIWKEWFANPMEMQTSLKLTVDFARIYIGAIFVNNLPRLCTSNVNRF